MKRAALPVDERLVCRLAGLARASREAIEATIALWPLVVRRHLADVGIISIAPDRDAAKRGETSDFAVTEQGMKIIADCAARRKEKRTEAAEQAASEKPQILYVG